MRAVVLAVALALFAVAASAIDVHKSGQQVLDAESAVESAAANCDCGWANSGTCGNNDGSVCFQQCCKTGQDDSKCRAISGSCGAKNACAGSIITGKCPGSTYCCVKPSGGGSGGSGSGGGSGGGADPTLTQSGVTTRYWDCCKPSCAWPSNVPSGRGSVRTCARDGKTTADANAKNVCTGGGGAGTSYTCSNQQPFVSGGVGYGFVATQIGQCCDCFELQFQSTLKKMVVQRTNTGGDLSQNQFDIQIPGGGVGLFNGCSANQQNGPAQWGGAFQWGQTYGGVSSKAACAQLPGDLQAGCQFRFDWVGDNPKVKFKKVTCPAVLTQISGCRG